METTPIFGRAHLDEIKKALNVYAERHRVIAANVANVETLGFKAREYKFEELLRKSAGRLQGVTSQPDHLPIGRRSLVDAEGKSVKQDGRFSNGINNVDIDKEMGRLSTNDLSYQLATRLLSMKYRILRGAITGRVR